MRFYVKPVKTCQFLNTSFKVENLIKYLFLKIVFLTFSIYTDTTEESVWKYDFWTLLFMLICFIFTHVLTSNLAVHNIVWTLRHRHTKVNVKHVWLANTVDQEIFKRISVINKNSGDGWKIVITNIRHNKKYKSYKHGKTLFGIYYSEIFSKKICFTIFSYFLRTSLREESSSIYVYLLLLLFPLFASFPTSTIGTLAQG